MSRHFMHLMELYIIENYRDLFPALSGSALTDALIRDLFAAYGLPDVRIARTEQGKPYIEAAREEEHIHFSVSHSGNYFVCLIDAHPVGVDIQHARKIDARKIGKRYFTDEEQAVLAEQGEKGFFTLWARKEAYCKYTGNGLAEIIKGTSVWGRDDVAFLDFQIEKDLYCSCCMMKGNEG